jgi:hypothetical protein
MQSAADGQHGNADGNVIGNGDRVGVGDYNQIFSGWVEVNASLPTGKLELLTLELHPPTRSGESVSPPAGS